MPQDAIGGGKAMGNPGLFVKTRVRFMTENEARSVGAYNITKIVFPPDHWGTQVHLFEATVKVKKVAQ